MYQNSSYSREVGRDLYSRLIKMAKKPKLDTTLAFYTLNVFIDLMVKYIFDLNLCLHTSQ